MKVKFQKEEDTRAGKVFLVLNYMSGDADGDFPEEIELPGVIFDKNLDTGEDIEQVIKDYILISEITDVNSQKHLDDYDEIKEQYGEDIANSWDNGKNDPQSDYSEKCHLNQVFLRGYDQLGNKYETDSLN
jgi:hypothetical protein